MKKLFCLTLNAIMFVSVTLAQNLTIPVKDGLYIEMVKVEAGSFNLPNCRITLPDDFYIGKYEVTQALWQAVMGSNPSEFKGDDLPVECVSWKECQKFISKLDSITGKRFRLPSEAEWEYATRGGKKSRGHKYRSAKSLDKVAWYVRNSDFRTHVVGTKKANELEIHDMNGNVAEWCQGWMEYYAGFTLGDLSDLNSGKTHIARGGNYGENVEWFGHLAPRKICRSYQNYGIGLRLALSE